MSRPLSVVLIDDNGDDNFVHSRIIEKSGVPATVRSYQYAEHALDYLRRRDRDPVDLIFVDLVMPRMDGFDFVEQFEQLPRVLRMGVVVYALSISPRTEYRELTSTNPVLRGFIDKPLRREIICNVVGEYFPAFADAAQRPS